MTETPPNPTRNRLFSKLAASLVFLIGSAGPSDAQESASAAQPANAQPDEIVELTPFVVDSSQDTGYRATSTLAGTRIRTDLKDLGSAISIVTAEFMEDTGATDATTLLSYTTNTEVGGDQGNFSGAQDHDDGRYLQNDARTDPQFNQRIRGLGSADLTRGFFLTAIPFDSYNADRIEVSRGPNSLLFGIGSPGGVINNSTNRAIQNQNFGKTVFRVDNYGSTRSALDLNRSLVKGRVALRIAGLYDDQRYKQEPTWKRDERVYGALDAILLKNEKSNIIDATRLRVNGESGTSQSSPVEIIPPSVAYHGWFEPTPASIQRFSGIAPAKNVLAPSEGGTWEFQTTYNPFVVNSEGGINTNTHPSIFRHIGVIFPSANATTADVGTGDGLQGYPGLIPWRPALDTLDSTGLAGTPGVGGRRGNARVRSFTEYHTNSPYSEPYGIGFAVPTLQNPAVFDYRNKIYSGGIDFVKRKFNAANIALEQGFFRNRLAFEFAYDKQHYESLQDFFFAGSGGTTTTGPYDVYVAIAEFLPNGQPNPNLGRAYTRVQQSNLRFHEMDHETFRVTASADLNLKQKRGWWRHLGRHRLTALYDDHTKDNHNLRWQEAWVTDTFNFRAAQQAPRINHVRSTMDVMVFTSDSLIGVPSMNDVRLDQINIRRPQPGDTFNVLYADVSSRTAPRKLQTGTVTMERWLAEEGISRTHIKSKAIAWQSYLLDEHIVGLWGFRRDDTESFARATEGEVGYPMRLPDGRIDPTFARLSQKPSLEESGDTVTWSVVARYPKRLFGTLPLGADLQAHYAESENFNPIGLRNDALGRFIGQPTGTTKEYGFLAGFADNKFSVKVNWFQTQLKDVNAGVNINVAQRVVGRINNYRDAELYAGIPFADQLQTVNGNPAAFPIQSYDAFYTALENTLPSALHATMNIRREDTDGDGVWDRMRWDSIPNLRSTQDLASKGLEVELVANPTSSWRILGNVSRQQTVQTNTAKVMAAVVEEYDRNLQAARLGELRDSASGTAILRPYNDVWRPQGLAALRGVVAFDNTLSNEQREWRITGVSNYEFKEGRLRGFSLGGAARWQSKAATGYVFKVEETTGVPVPDVSQPFYDDGLFSGDLWFSYQRKIFDRIRWKIQLNIRNLIRDSSDIPVKTNPDGQVAVVRIPNPRTVYLTNTFRF